MIVLGFHDTSTVVGHFVSSPREREKRYRRDSSGDEKEGQGRKRKMNESEENRRNKNIPLYPYQALPNCKPISVQRPGDARYTTPLPYPTTPAIKTKRCFNVFINDLIYNNPGYFRPRPILDVLIYILPNFSCLGISIFKNDLLVL